MSLTDELLGEIEAFRGKHGMAESTFGQKAVNDGKLVSRLRAGGSVTLSTADKIRGFMSSYRAAAVQPCGAERPAA